MVNLLQLIVHVHTYVQLEITPSASYLRANGVNCNNVVAIRIMYYFEINSRALVNHTILRLFRKPAADDEIMR